MPDRWGSFLVSKAGLQIADMYEMRLPFCVKYMPKYSTIGTARDVHHAEQLPFL
jgi:hypothetical protein